MIVFKGLSKSLLFLLSGMLLLLAACTQENVNVSFLQSNKAFLPKLIITSSAQVLPAGSCSQMVTVELRSALDAPMMAESDMTLLLTSDHMSYFSDVTCTTPITTLTMTTGTPASSFYFSSSTSGLDTLSVSSPIAVSASQIESITAAAVTNVAFSPNPMNIDVGVCSATPVQLRMTDTFNNPGLPPSDVDVSISTPGVQLFTDATCTTALPDPVTLTSATGTQNIYLLKGSQGTYILTGSASGFTSGNLTVNAYPPLTISGTTAQAYLNEVVNFTANGGKTPYVYSAAGGSINTSTGQYTATALGTYIVQVTDDLGGVASTSITVNSALDLLPNAAVVKAGQSLAMSVSGGFSTFNFSIVSGFGTYDPGINAFTAPTIPGSTIVRVTDARGTTDDSFITITPADPASLYFITAAQNSITGLCSSLVEVGMLDQYGNTTTADRNYTVTPSGNGFSFYSDATCTTPLSSPIITMGSSQVGFYYVATVPGFQDLNVNSTPTLIQATQTVSVTAATLADLKFTPDTLNMVAGECKPTTLSLVDVYGNAGIPSSSVTVNIALTASVDLYTDNICSMPVGLPITLTTAIPNRTLYVRSTVSSNAAHNATSSGLSSANLNTFISPDAPYKLAFATTPQPVETRNYYFNVQPQVTVVDQYDNLITTASNTVILSTAIDPTCTAATGSSLIASTNPLAAIAGVAQFNGVKYPTVENIYLRADASGLARACSSKIRIKPDYSQSMTFAPSNVPSDGLASATLMFIPKIDGTKVGEGALIEIESSSTNVVVSCNGSACTSCTNPSSTCYRAYDSGHGAYTITVKNATTEGVQFDIKHRNGIESDTVDATNVTFSTAAFTTMSANSTITSANAGQNLYLTGGNITFDATTAGQTFGHIFVRGATITHTASTISTVNKLDIIAASFHLLSGSVDVTGRGYLYSGSTSYSYGPTTPSTALGSTGTGSTGAGGSHAGRGGVYSSFTSGITYGNYRNPVFPGGGGSLTSAAGGGVIKIQSNSTCNIGSGANIRANGSENGAGGSIQLICNGFTGDASAGAITANGGTPSSSSTNGGGGGGRIALHNLIEEAGFTGAFRYPSTMPEMIAFNNTVQARGGTSVSPGGAGTVFLHFNGQSQGGLIVDNAGTSGKATELPSLIKTTQAPTGSDLPFSPSLGAGQAGLYKGLRLRPDISADQGTPGDLLDDNIVTITENTLSSLTISGSISSVVAGKVLRTIDVLDHLYIGGSATLATSSDVVILNGSFTSPTLEYTNGLLTLSGGAKSYPNINQVDLTAGNYGAGSAAANNILINGGSLSATGIVSANKLTVNSGSFSATSLEVSDDFIQNGGTTTITNITGGKDVKIAGGTGTFQNITLVNDFIMTGGTVTHPAGTTTVPYRLIMTLGGKFALQGGNINVTGKGYPVGYSYGASGVPNVSLVTAAAAHGGQGYGGTGVTYGDYKNPEYPGTGVGTAGGGVVKVIATGPCIVDSPSSIVAKGADNGVGASGAGGSINLKCAAFTGNGASTVLNASGGSASIVANAGGGGRISLVTTNGAASFVGSFAVPTDLTSMTNFTNNIQARGGTGTNGGGAGTIFIKHNGFTYGGLIVHNNGVSSSGLTLLPYLHKTNNAFTTFAINFSPLPNSAYVDLYKNILVRPDISANNGTPGNPLDDFITNITSNLMNEITVSNALTGYSIGAEFRTLEILDHLYISGQAELAVGSDMVVTTGNFMTNTVSIPNGYYSPLDGGQLYSPP